MEEVNDREEALQGSMGIPLSALDAPFDHIDPKLEPSFSWHSLFTHREDMPRVTGEHRSVCVVGGGIAGLVTAYELSRRRFGVTLLEGSERCGGRVHTHYFSETAYGELGAMRIPLMHSAVIDYVEQFGLPTRPYVNMNPAGRFYFDGVGGTIGVASIHADGTQLTEPSARYSALATIFTRLAKITDEGLASGPRRMLFDLIVTPLLRRLRRDSDKWALLDLGSRGSLVTELRATKLADYAVQKLGLTSDDWSFLSRATGVACLQECSVAQFVLDMFPTLLSSSMVEIVGGMELLPRAFGERLRDAVIVTGAKVERVAVADSGVCVSWREMGRMMERSFDWVVVAVPPPNLLEIELICPTGLARKRRALQEARMGPLAKTVCYFKERFWELAPAEIFGGLSFTSLGSQQCWYPCDNSERYRDEGGQVRYRARSQAVAKGPGILTAAYRWGAGARSFSILSDEERTSAAIRDLAKIHGVDDSFVAERIEAVVHKYWQNGFTFLAGRLQRDLETPLRDANAAPRVFFAGEHLSTVHGWIVSAVMSALRAVKGVLGTREQSVGAG